MNVALLKKCIHESKWLLLACSTALFAFCWLRVGIVSQIDTERFQAILALLPNGWQKFSPVEFSWLITYAGRISLTYDEPIVVLCISLWAIARGSDVVSGELGRGTMEMLLAQPLSRMQVLTTQSLVTLTGVVVLAFASWLGVYCGIQTNTVKETVYPSFDLMIVDIPIPFTKGTEVETPLRDKVDTTVFIPAAFALACLGAMLAGVSTLMSSWDRYRWRTIGIVAGFYVVSVIVKLVGMAYESLHFLVYGSVFTAYEPEAFVKAADLNPASAWQFMSQNADGSWVIGPLGYDFALLALSAVCFIAAGVVFQRRDLPAPL